MHTFHGRIKNLWRKVCFHLFATFISNVCLLALCPMSRILVKTVPKQTPQQWLPVAVSHYLLLLFSSLKTILCIAVTFNFGSKCGTKDRRWCKQKWDVQCLNSPSDFGRSPSSTNKFFWNAAAGELTAEMHMCSCNSLILTSGSQWKRSIICNFTIVLSLLKDKMHLTCLTRSLAKASGRVGNFTPLSLRKI